MGAGLDLPLTTVYLTPDGGSKKRQAKRHRRGGRDAGPRQQIAGIRWLLYGQVADVLPAVAR